MRRLSKILAIGVGALALTACQQTTMGTQQGVISGAAGPSGGTASAQLERCDRPLGVIALVEGQDPSMQASLASFGLGSPIPVLRLLMQQSNCFQVVDRGQAMQNIMQERDLAQQGHSRRNSNMGGGQLVAADLVLSPNIIFSGNTGGGGAGLAGALIPGWGGVLASSVMGSVKFTSAQSVLTLTDVRSGIQVSAAQGTATARDMNLGAALFGGGWGGGMGGGVGGYSNTPEGQVIAASLMDAYNGVVRTVRGMPPLPSVSGRRG